MSHPNASWSIAIIAAREQADTLAATVHAAIRACHARQVTIDVLINGNPGLAQHMAALANRGTFATAHAAVRVWALARGDKASTWNEYLHRIWTDGTPAFFIDGYVQVQPDALHLLHQRLEQPDAPLAVTAVPSQGRSAPAARAHLLTGGGLQGNLHAIAAAPMAALRRMQFRLPLGIYRTDSVIGAVLMYNLDPSRHTWDARRIAVEPAASWAVDDIARLTGRNIMGQFKRMLRQAQGELENRAVREHMTIRRLPPQELPRTNQDLVNGWLRTHRREARLLFVTRPVVYYSARRLRATQHWPDAELAPHLLTAHAGDGVRA